VVREIPVEIVKEIPVYIKVMQREREREREGGLVTQSAVFTPTNDVVRVRDCRCTPTERACSGCSL